MRDTSRTERAHKSNLQANELSQVKEQEGNVRLLALPGEL